MRIYEIYAQESFVESILPLLQFSDDPQQAEAEDNEGAQNYRPRSSGFLSSGKLNLGLPEVLRR
jgi:hypothetical protein